jgi:hypothetical protein
MHQAMSCDVTDDAEIAAHGRDVDASELGGLASRAFAVSDREGAMNRDQLVENNSAPDRTTDEIIAECGGDPNAAVIELLAIIRSLIHENQALREASSPGFARRRPIVFGKPS